MDGISITAAAKQTGFHRRTLHRWIKDGLLTPQRTPGGKPFFTREQVEAISAPAAEADNG